MRIVTVWSIGCAQPMGCAFALWMWGHGICTDDVGCPPYKPYVTYVNCVPQGAVKQVTMFINVAFALYASVLLCIFVVLFATKRLGLLQKSSFFILLVTAVMVITVLACLGTILLLQDERLVRAYRKENLRQLGNQVPAAPHGLMWRLVGADIGLRVPLGAGGRGGSA